MRINGNKPQGENTMKEKIPKQKKLLVTPPGFEPASQLPPAQKGEASYHWAMRPLHNLSCKINSVKIFLSYIHTVMTCGGVFIMNSKVHLRKNSLNKYLKAISHYFRVYSLSGIITAAR